MLSSVASALFNHGAPALVPGGCAHCGLPLPSDAVVVSDGRNFCCAGCQTVFTAIRGAGLGAFYDNRDLGSSNPRPARPSGRRFAELDEPGFETTFERHADGTLSVELQLEGVHCAACVWLVESLPRVAEGVREARLDFGRSTARVRWDPATTRLSGVARVLDGLGYTPHPLGRVGAARRGDRALLMRLGVAGAIAGNVMLMSLALYSGAGNGADVDFAEFFRWGSLLLSLPAMFYCAGLFYRGAWASLRTRTPNMDLPIAIGITAGFVSGAVNTWRGRGEIYFDTIATLIFLLLVGRWLGQRHQRRASAAADVAHALAPSTARLIEGEARREVLSEAAPKQALVEVLAGERIPVDGRVEAGESTLDARLLTGESSPVEVKPGDRVYAGTENLGGVLRVRVERAGRETRVGQLVASMERAQSERAPIVRTADRIAGRFAVAVLVLAGLTLAVWWRIDPHQAVDHAVALLVVTCPCALGMATPLAVSVALARAARRGILVKGGDVLEALARPAKFVFDKSGTLTAGRPELIEWHGSTELAARVSAAELGCDHPLARAFRRAFVAVDAPVASVERFTGAGLRAVVGGRTLVVGTLALMEQAGIDVSPAFRGEAHACAAAGLTPVLVADEGRVRGLAAFGDALRPDALPSLFELEKLGASMSVISGDHPLVVERVCGGLPVEVARGGVSPEQKLAEITAAVRRGERVVMVGDGVNDAAAMSAATVGFAVHGGAEASLLAASAFSTEPGVAPVVEAVRGARATLQAIHRGLAFSLAYNAVGVVLAMSGLLSPLVAAVMMPLSSLTVVTSALRSRAFAAPLARRSAPERGAP
ncbi:MAG TPA: heavy metal translocating P-type ATPase [Polyangiaceae bacterium]